ncbi:MAG: anhydro-N-acetylmuramic acid kinase, partial [Planctomycetota bacterium]
PCLYPTCMDGIDAALLRAKGTGLAMQCEFVEGTSTPLPHAETLRAFSNGASLSARTLASIARDVGDMHKDLITGLVRHSTPDLIVMHGQTVLHSPPLSWQLVDPWPVASAFDCRVVTDLRSRSLASGGQGAPLTPLADWILFRNRSDSRCIANLGGFVNLTMLPAQPEVTTILPETVRGEDVCPCNLILDRLARELLDTPYDDEGQTGLGGSVHPAVAGKVADRFVNTGSRSLGTGDEAMFVDDAVRQLSAGDALATVCDAIARPIASKAAGSTLVLAGGGVQNAALMRSLERHHRGRMHVVDELGIPARFREAVAFGVLGALAEDGVPVSLPQITGATTTGRDGQWILP